MTRYLLILCFSFCALFASPSYARQEIVPPFIFKIKADRAVVTQADFGPIMTLHGLKGKTAFGYRADPQKNTMITGYVDTQALLIVWQARSKRANQSILSLVSFPTIGRMLPLSPLGLNDVDHWVFAITPVKSKIKSHLNNTRLTKLGPGSYEKPVISSYLLPINVIDLPHSICPATLDETECYALPLKMPSNKKK